MKKIQQKDDIRILLDKIRKLQNENYQIRSLESADITEIVNLREHRKVRQLLKEEEFQEVTPDEQREEENKFKDTVSKLVMFDKMKVYRQNVEWSGQLVREKVKWVYSLTENNGCFIAIENEDMLQLTTEVIETFKKLKGYYDVWADEWGARLTGSPTEDGGEEGTAAPENNQPTAAGAQPQPGGQPGGVGGGAPTGGFGV